MKTNERKKGEVEGRKGSHENKEFDEDEKNNKEMGELNNRQGKIGKGKGEGNVWGVGRDVKGRKQGEETMGGCDK